MNAALSAYSLAQCCWHSPGPGTRCAATGGCLTLAAMAFQLVCVALLAAYAGARATGGAASLMQHQPNGTACPRYVLISQQRSGTRFFLEKINAHPEVSFASEIFLQLTRGFRSTSGHRTTLTKFTCSIAQTAVGIASTSSRSGLARLRGLCRALVPATCSQTRPHFAPTRRRRTNGRSTPCSYTVVPTADT